MKKTLALLILLSVTAWAYHEFQVPKKAYKKVTTEYFSNDTLKTQPDSTMIVYYGMKIDTVGWYCRKGDVGRWCYYSKDTIGCKSIKPDIQIFYIEIYREVKKGCGNIIGVSEDWGVDFGHYLLDVRSTIADTVKYLILDGDSLRSRH